MRLAAALALGLAGPAGAECRLALILAIDVSSSVDATEDRLQRQGLAAALRAPEVAAAALAVPGQWVSLGVYEWSGRWRQATLLDWTTLTDRAAMRRAADRIAGSARGTREYPTAMGYALAHGATRLGERTDCLFRTLDISGDGVNNDGFPPDASFRHFDFAGVTVNALAIAGEAAVAEYYRDEVVRGPGAFLEIARGFRDFERAMRRKLEREMAVWTLGALAPARRP